MSNVRMNTLRNNRWVPLGLPGEGLAGSAELAGSGQLAGKGRPQTVEQFLWGFQQFPGTTGSDDAYLRRGGSNFETPAAQHARNLTTFGRDDIQKLFYSGNLPAVWNSAREGVNTQTKTVMVCHKQGGMTAQATIDIVNGLHTPALKSYLQSIPWDWWVELVYVQEADSAMTDGGLGGSHWCTKAQYKAAFNYIAQLIHDEKAAGRVAPGVWAHANFMNAAFRQGVWTDDRVPNKADHISWDTYLAPPPGSGAPVITGSVYENSTNINARVWAAAHAAAAARILDENGIAYTGRWGWAEIGAPFRSGDVQSVTGRPDGAVRADTFTNLLTELRNAGAYFGIIWNSDVGQWDHRLLDRTTTPAPVAKTDGSTWNPAIVPTPNREPAIAAIRAVFGT